MTDAISTVLKFVLPTIFKVLEMNQSLFDSQKIEVFSDFSFIFPSITKHLEWSENISTRGVSQDEA